jgi:glycosyltransferase involved in cell wall biosynthesis
MGHAAKTIMNEPSAYRCSLSVVMPALNEERNVAGAIEDTLATFDRLGLDAEVFVVNDGSSDRTGEIAAEYSRKDPRVKVISHPVNMGIGRSFFDGVGAATKEAVVLIAGDHENGAEEVLTYLSVLEHVDIVVPFIYNLEVRNKFRRLLSSVYRFVINLSFGTSLTYTNGTVIYRRAVLKEIALQSAGFFYQAELLIRLIRKGYLYAEVPNFLARRNTGKSKAVTFRSLRNVVKSYLRLAFLIHIKRIEARKSYRDLDPSSATHRRCSKSLG